MNVGNAISDTKEEEILLRTEDEFTLSLSSKKKKMPRLFPNLAENLHIPPLSFPSSASLVPYFFSDEIHLCFSGQGEDVGRRR